MSQRITKTIFLTAAEAAAYKSTGTCQHVTPDGDTITVSDTDTDCIVYCPEDEPIYDISYLCYGRANGADVVEIPDLTTLQTYNDYAEYLSYDHTTKKFTVLKDFYAVITSWVYQYQAASQSTASGELYINNSNVAHYSVRNTSKGVKAGATYAVKLTTGDELWVYTPSTSGYSQQNIKVSKVNEKTFSLFEALMINEPQNAQI